MDIAQVKNNIDVGQNYHEKKLSVWEMQFDSKEDAYQWYNEYVREVGFSIRKEWRNCDKLSGVVQSRRFVCCKERFRKEEKRRGVIKPRKETRCGCLVGLTVALQVCEKYRATDFESSHNHELADKSCVHILPSQRSISVIQALEIYMIDNSGIQPKLAHELMSHHVGGRENLGFTPQDQKNYLRNKRRHDLKQGKVDSLLHYFHKQLSQHPSFFFQVQMDIKDQITKRVKSVVQMQAKGLKKRIVLQRGRKRYKSCLETRQKEKRCKKIKAPMPNNASPSTCIPLAQNELKCSEIQR